MICGRRRKVVPPYKYIVWKRIGKTTVEAERFFCRYLAENFICGQEKLNPSIKFQINKVGEMPVWEEERDTDDH